jgi:hypothetical protein
MFATGESPKQIGKVPSFGVQFITQRFCMSINLEPKPKSGVFFATKMVICDAPDGDLANTPAPFLLESLCPQ